MTLSFTGRKRIRKNFGRIPEVTSMPNLIEVQKSSYQQFLQMDTAPGDRGDDGLNGVFRGVFPIKDFSETGSCTTSSSSWRRRSTTSRSASSAA